MRVAAFALGEGMGRAGRPRKLGDRFPSGKLVNKKPGEGIPPALLGRLKNAVIKVLKDARWENEVGRLSLNGELSNTQAAAAHKVADVYHAYHRVRSLKAHAKSQSYERGFGSADLAEERMTAEELTEFEAKVRRATEAWERLDQFLAGLDRRLRQAVMDVCIYSTPTNPMLLPALRTVLDALAQRWADGWRQTADKPRELKLVHPKTSLEAKPSLRRDSITEPLESVVKKIRPDLDQDGVKLVVETFYALRARVEFRRTKETRRGN